MARLQRKPYHNACTAHRSRRRHLRDDSRSAAHRRHLAAHIVPLDPEWQGPVVQDQRAQRTAHSARGPRVEGGQGMKYCVLVFKNGMVYDRQWHFVEGFSINTYIREMLRHG